MTATSSVPEPTGGSAGEPLRPAAAAALRRLHAEGEPETCRGRLRLLIGAAPGVGKTYAMLMDGRRRRAGGEDVVVGLVETHGRARTEEAIGDLEVVPRKLIPYKSISIEEMDLDRILARRPRVVLVDELAHANAPGSRHERRWQDVQELLAAGIDVVGTLNIQHLESLNDVIESITGVRVRETVPDALVDRADELQLVDVAPETLQERLRRGEIYPPDRAQAALTSYFRKGNLAALRELALRRIALEVEDDIEAYRQEHQIGEAWPAQERVVVLLDHRCHARRLMRSAARLARGLRAELIAVSIGDPDRLKPEARTTLRANLQLAEDLGATCHALPGGDLTKALTAFVRAQGITQLVLNQPPRSRLEIMLRGSTFDQVLRQVPNLEVHLVAVQSPHGSG